MTLGDLLARWEERDSRYRLPHGTRVSDELADGIRAHRAWEITKYLTGSADRRVAFKTLGKWLPPHPITF